MVDDHASFREGLAQLLDGAPGLRVTRHFNSIQPLLNALAEERPPDIVLLDLNIGKENGLLAIRPARKLAPSVRILMLTTFNNTFAEAEAFRSGASAFLLKIYEINEIIELIHQSFYRPDDPRLFPNLAFYRNLEDSRNAQTTAVAGINEQPGLFSALRHLCRPQRRQPGK